MGLQTFEVCLCIYLALTLVVARRQHSLGWISYLLSNLVTKSVMVELIFRSLWERHFQIKKKKKMPQRESLIYSVTRPSHFLSQNVYLMSILLFLYLHKVFLKLWLCKPHSLVLEGIYDLFVQLSRAHLVTYVINLENAVGFYVCGLACTLSTWSIVMDTLMIIMHLSQWSYYFIFIKTHFIKKS